MKVCKECNLEKIINLKVYGSGNSSGVGFVHKPNPDSFFGGIDLEFLYAELCESCGTVNRFYVKNFNRHWSDKTI